MIINNTTDLIVSNKIRVYSSFEPSAIVLQCGADILFGDHVGQCNVTINALVKCVKKVIDCNIPCLVLGGGSIAIILLSHWYSLTNLFKVDIILQIQRDIGHVLPPQL